MIQGLRMMSRMILFLRLHGLSIIVEYIIGIRVSTSLGHPQVPVGLSVGNPQVK